MEFTKEEIEVAKKLYFKYTSEDDGCYNFSSYLDSLLKPETKFINVRIEVDSDLTANGLRDLLMTFGFLKIYSVTELPEVFTREDMIKFADSFFDVPEFNPEIHFDVWLSERKSK